VVVRKQLPRPRLLPCVAPLTPCLIGMEACQGAHDWAREMRQLGHDVRVMSPPFVTPYRKSHKHDPHDAAAICEAVSPVMRNYAVRPLRHATRRHGTTWLPPVLKGLALRVWGLALFHRHSTAPAGHTSNLSTDMARMARPGSWEHDGPQSGGLRWSTRITSTVSADHATGTDMVARSRGMATACP
jgi:hypothetical protein